MRIAVVTELGRLVGGTETYIEKVLQQLSLAGHEQLFWYARDEPEGRRPLRVPAGGTTIDAAARGARKAVEELRDWRPDVVFVHGLIDVRLLDAVAEIAPSVFFA